jgi:1-acyl-sn-glycerol-3-phosphate acyltransferase
VIVIAILALNGVGLVTAVPVSFPSDVYRPESPRRALTGFFHDCSRIARTREARSYLLALAGLRGLAMAAVGPLLAIYLGHVGESAQPTAVSDPRLIHIAVLILLGTAAGALLAGVQAHPTRALGLVPFAATGFVVGLVLAGCLQAVPWWLCLWIGAMGGIINVPLFASYQATLPADARGNGIAILNTAGYACMALLALAMFGLVRLGFAGNLDLWLIIGLAALGAVLAWRWLLRDSFEQVVEFAFWPLYRIRGHGPGLENMPRTGPLLVMANHTAYPDPIWLAKVLPRRLTGMLTSVFFDKPFLRFLGTYVVPTIRVESSRFRREAPELNDAIAALDRGEAVLIFPEGRMRRSLEQPLHQFGRGVWHILKERPKTPVVVCWIEGGWGSFASYTNGPPGKNKPVDRWWPIDVAVSEPQTLDAAMLADHRATRSYLMQRCAETRRYLGLEPLTLKEEASEPAEEDDKVTG